MSEMREAFDLTHKPCRRNFKNRIKENWNRLYWWKLVFSDTVKQLCSKEAKDEIPKDR